MEGGGWVWLRPLLVTLVPRSMLPCLQDSAGRGVPERPVARPAGLLTALRPRGGALVRETTQEGVGGWHKALVVGGGGLPHAAGVAEHTAKNVPRSAMDNGTCMAEKDPFQVDPAQTRFMVHAHTAH